MMNGERGRKVSCVPCQREGTRDGGRRTGDGEEGDQGERRGEDDIFNTKGRKVLPILRKPPSTGTGAARDRRFTKEEG